MSKVEGNLSSQTGERNATHMDSVIVLSTEEYERTKREGGFIVDPFTGEGEYDIEDSDIDGKGVPDDLVGVLYRTGPGESII